MLHFNDVPVVDAALQAHVPITNNITFELAALNTLMEAAVSHHDANLWAQFYSDDALLCSQRLPMHDGKKAINSYLETHCKELPIFEKLNIRNDRVDDLGKYIIEYATHIAIIRNGDFSAVSTGKDLAIWRREPNGSLKIFRHIGMYD
jgi:ketosteroid isomerase-like protein